MAKILLNIMKCAFDLHDIPDDDDVDSLFNTYLLRFTKSEKNLVVVGISAIFWTVWKLKNSIICYNNKVMTLVFLST